MATAAPGRRPLGMMHLKLKGCTALDLKPGPQAVAWADIRPRSDADTRHLDPRHVLSLARSIAAVGLVQPIAIDTTGRLIAGGHRLAAWSLLAIEDPAARRTAVLTALEHRAPGKAAQVAGKRSESEDLAQEVADLDATAWREAHAKGLVPVLAFDADASRIKNKALLREVAENEKRRSYTVPEVKALADRLRKAGFVDLNGRPAGEQASVRQELASILGKSLRQVRRLLNDPDLPPPRRPIRARDGRPMHLLRNLSGMLTTVERALANDKNAKPLLDAATELAKRIAAYQPGRVGYG